MTRSSPQRVTRRPPLATAFVAIVIALTWTLADEIVGSDLPLTDQIDQSSRDLAGLRQQIASRRSALTELATQQASAQSEFDAVNEEMTLITDLLAGLERREVMLTQQCDSLRIQVAGRREQYAQQQRQLGLRMRALYQRGPRQGLELALTADSFSALVARVKFDAVLARLDAALMQETRVQSERLDREQRELQAALVSIWEAREEATRESLRLETLEAERAALLRALEQRQARAAAQLGTLEKRQQQLADLLSELSARHQEGELSRQTGGGLAESAGDLPWPVVGEIVRGFGRSVHPEFKTVTMNNGVNIAAAAGSPVCAVAPGKVEFADRLPGFGLCVILEHGAGYYTLYANLARVFAARGERIDLGEVVAEVGASQAAGLPQLYFEIRKGRTPLDPTEWLQSRH